MIDSLQTWHAFTADIGGALAASGEILTWLEDMTEINVRLSLSSVSQRARAATTLSTSLRHPSCPDPLPALSAQSLEDALEHMELEEGSDDDDGEGCVSPGGTARSGLWAVLNFEGSG